VSAGLGVGHPGADTVPAEDGGHRALPVRLPAAGAFWRLLTRPGDRDQEHPVDDLVQELGYQFRRKAVRLM
jgi:hypothetical protein